MAGPRRTTPATVATVETPRPKRSPIIMKGSSAPGRSVTVENNSGSPPKLGQVISSSAQISFVSSSQTNALPATATPPGGSGRAIESRTASTSPSAAKQAPALAMETNPGKPSDGPKPLPAVSQPPLV